MKNNPKLKSEIGTQEIAGLRMIASLVINKHLEDEDKSPIPRNVIFQAAKAVTELDIAMHEQDLCDADDDECAYEENVRNFNKIFKKELSALAMENYD